MVTLRNVDRGIHCGDGHDALHGQHCLQLDGHHRHTREGVPPLQNLQPGPGQPLPLQPGQLRDGEVRLRGPSLSRGHGRPLPQLQLEPPRLLSPLHRGSVALRES